MESWWLLCHVFCYEAGKIIWRVHAQSLSVRCNQGNYVNTGNKERRSYFTQALNYLTKPGRKILTKDPKVKSKTGPFAASVQSAFCFFGNGQEMCTSTHLYTHNGNLWLSRQKTKATGVCHSIARHSNDGHFKRLCNVRMKWMDMCHLLI